MLQSSEIFCWDVESTAQQGAELQALGFHLLNWVLGNTSRPDTPCVTYQFTVLICGEQKYWISKSCEIEIKNGLYNIHFILSSEVIFFIVSQQYHWATYDSILLHTELLQGLYYRELFSLKSKNMETKATNTHFATNTLWQFEMAYVMK